MSAPELLARATDLAKMPVVTVDDGEDVAEVRDVLYDADAGRLLGFTLNKRGFLAGRMKAVLPFAEVVAVGRDAVMIPSADALADKSEPLAQEATQSAKRNVIGDDVLTDGGRKLGVVTDVVVELVRGEIVGYQLKGDEALQGHAGATLLIPIPHTLAVSGTALVVPAAVHDFIRDDLTGFGGAVADFRARLGEPVR